MAKKKSEEKSQQQNGDAKNEKEVNFDEEPNFSDPEGYVDSITDEELLGDILEQKPKETDGVESVIVVDGVPQIGPERLEKLKSVINKTFAKIGNIVNEYYPVTEQGHTKGYIFLEYVSPQHAAEAVKVMNNYKLDKQHTFQVNLFTDFCKYEQIPDEWSPPEPRPYQGQSDLYQFLLEPDAYDQFGVVTQDNTVQIWQNTQPEPTLVEERTATGALEESRKMREYLNRMERDGVQRVKMFLIITAAYVLFWGPLFFVTLVNHPIVGNPLGHEITLHISYLHAIVNPTLFMVLHRGLRRATLDLCCGWIPVWLGPPANVPPPPSPPRTADISLLKPPLPSTAHPDSSMGDADLSLWSQDPMDGMIQIAGGELSPDLTGSPQESD